MWTIKQTNRTKQNSLARLTMVWWCPSPSEHHELLCTHQQTLHLKLCCLFQPNDSRPLHQLKDKFTQKSYITGLRIHFHQPLKHQSFVQHRKFKCQIQHYTITLTLDRHRDEFQGLNLWNTMPRATHWQLLCCEIWVRADDLSTLKIKISILCIVCHTFLIATCKDTCMG